MWRQGASSLALAFVCGCGSPPAGMSEASPPAETPSDLVLETVAFVRLSEGRVSSRGTAEELTYRRSAGSLLAPQAPGRPPPPAAGPPPPRPGSDLAALGMLHLSAPRVEADTAGHRATGLQGVSFDSERGDRARTD